MSRTTKSSFEDETAFLSEQYVINLQYVGSKWFILTAM